MTDEERARQALESAMAEWEAGKGKTEVSKALEGPKEASDAIQRMMIKEFWQRAKKYC